MMLFNSLGPPPHFVYIKDLGWDELDDEDEKCRAMVVVVDANFGFNVFRFGGINQHIGWYSAKEDAIEYAVDCSRQDIAEHEFMEYRGEDSV